VEQGPIREVLEHPAHPYTALLTASAPSVESIHRLRPDDVRAGEEDAAARAEWTAQGGCVFAARCRFAVEACRTQPALTGLDPAGDRSAACHLATTWLGQVRPHQEIA